MIRIVFALLVLVLLAGPALAQRNNFDLSRTRGLVHAHFLPAIDDTYDLGSATFEWRNLHIDGIGNIDTLRCDDLESSGGTDWAAVSGADVTLQGDATVTSTMTADVVATDSLAASDGTTWGTVSSANIDLAGTLDVVGLVTGGAGASWTGSTTATQHVGAGGELRADTWANDDGTVIAVATGADVAFQGALDVLGVCTVDSLETFEAIIDDIYTGSCSDINGYTAFSFTVRNGASVAQTTFTTPVEIRHTATGADINTINAAAVLLSAVSGELIVQNDSGPANIRCATLRATTGIQCATYTPYSAAADNVFRTHNTGYGHDFQCFGSVSAIKITTTGHDQGRSVVITATRMLTGAQHTGALTYGGTLGGGNEWGFSGDLIVDGDLYPGEDLHLATGKSIQWNSLDALTGDATGALTAEVSLDVTGVTTLGEGAVLGRLTSAPSGHVTSSAHLYLRRETNDSRTVVGFEGTVDGRLNFATGYQAQHALTTGHSNHATGYQAQHALTTGYSNHATGYQAQYFLTTGYSNHATGHQAQHALTTGYSNHATGYQAQYFLTTGYSNHATGYQAQYFLTTGYSNHATGHQAQYILTTGHSNHATGHYAQYFLTTGHSNHATGYQAQHALTTGHSNHATGYQAQYALTTGHSNHATGYYAQHTLTTGHSNHATGYQAQQYLTAGSNNVALGTSAAAGLASYASDDVIALGSYSVWKIPDGISNVVAMGKFSGVVPVSDNAYFGGYDPDTTTQYPLHLNYEVPAADISGATLNVAINRTDYYIPVSTTAGVLDASANPFKPKIYSQNDEPDIPNDTEAIWSDSDAGPIVYKLVDIGGTQYKRALDS